jgi:exonuclease III
MSANHLLIWNARDLNCRARRSVVRDIVEPHRTSVFCLQETKIEDLHVATNIEITGIDFDYAYLPAAGAAGGTLVAWRRNLWSAGPPTVRRFSVTMRLTPLDGLGDPWWLTNVYGPTVGAVKVDFLLEIRDIRAASLGPWLICGDFNMIYQACDINNGRLHRGAMHNFRSVLDDLQLEELHLSGRLFTWSNHRDNPTLERLDRVFATVEWLEQYACHHLRCLSSDYSDHAPLLLVLNSEPWAHPRFRFDDYWTKLGGFMEAVCAAWNAPVSATDPCRVLDQKLRMTAQALRS